MPPDNKIIELEQRIQELENILSEFVGSDRYTNQKDLQMFDGRKIIAGTGVGLQIGTEDTQKLGFMGATPVAPFSDVTGRQDTSGSSGIDMTTGHRFNGNTGTDYYSVGDIVYALKLNGIFKNQ